MGTLGKKADEPIYAICESAISGAGYIVTTTDASTDRVRLTDADYEVPFGVAIMGTLDTTKDEPTLLSGQSVAILRHGYAYVKLHQANTAVAKGDPLGVMYAVVACSGVGVVDKLTMDPTFASTYMRAAGSMVGYAMESIGASNGGLIYTDLRIRGV